MIRSLLSLYSPKYPRGLVYMLQASEYQSLPYLSWWWRTKDYSRVMHRRSLDRTKAARLLVAAMYMGMGVQIAVAVACIIAGAYGRLDGGIYFGLGVLLLTPIIWAHIIVLPIVLVRLIIQRPRQAALIKESRQIFAKHKGLKIAIAGSYGKTSMKELLVTVLSQKLNVAATPGNKNVTVSHAYFAKRLTGQEDVVIIEYGEGAPGDVELFSAYTQPTHAVITGIAPAHLDQYKTVSAAAKDIFSVASAVPKGNTYVNISTELTREFAPEGIVGFDSKQALGYSITGINMTIQGTSFALTKDKTKIHFKSGLVGRHQVPVLAFVAAFALQQGLTPQQVQAGIEATKPYEHRMQPYPLAGAWVIDDTYNGNLEGIRAGTELLSQLSAKRKIYVTPGLVDQGHEAQRVHQEIGQLITKASPDIVVLMRNSTTAAIQKGLELGGYRGNIRIEDNPLEFYQNLDQFVAQGDLVLMQNDWTDNYA